MGHTVSAAMILVALSDACEIAALQSQHMNRKLVSCQNVVALKCDHPAASVSPCASFVSVTLFLR